MTKAKAIKGSIEHWQRMIKWAKEQNSKDRALISTMAASIEEEWMSEYCPLCTKFYTQDTRILPFCTLCPLYLKYGSCGTRNNKKNLWMKVYDSRTWGVWVKNAEKFLAQLQSLLEK